MGKDVWERSLLSVRCCPETIIALKKLSIF